MPKEKKCVVCHDKESHTFLKKMHGYDVCNLCRRMYGDMSKKTFINELKELDKD